MPRKSESNSGG